MEEAEYEPTGERMNPLSSPVTGRSATNQRKGVCILHTPLGEERMEEKNQQALEPVEQETILFHGEEIMAAKLSDGRITVVIRWICNSLKLDPQGQVQRIQRTGATARELVRVRVQTKGGKQAMPAITLRGFSPWVLGMNPNEVKDDDPQEAERIRLLIVAYQEEAKDVLYEHFMNKGRPAVFPEQADSHVLPLPAEPSALPSGATHAELATYHAEMSLWHRWQADYYAEQWRSEIEEWRGSIEAQLEGDKELLKLIPEILEKIGPEKINDDQQTTIRGMVQRLHELSGLHQQTIYWQLSQAFQVPRYKELSESQYSAVVEWFRQRIEAAKAPKPKKPRG